MEQLSSKFIIRKENFDNALQALKDVFVEENMTCRDYVNGVTYPHFSWVDTDIVLNAITLHDALVEIRYLPQYNNGDMVDVIFNGEKYGDEEIFFSALAPYVEDCSYIQFEGEDGRIWKWSFDDGKVQYVYLGENET